MPLPHFSDRQVAGQRLMVGFEGTEITSELRYFIKELHVGGLILFAINLESPEQIQNLVRSAQEYAASCGQPPLLIAIDQEGGPVARLKEPFTRFPGNPAMKSTDDAIQFARITASELKSIGVNMNMAPVMDVPQKDIQSVMIDRAFGFDPEWVASMGNTVIQTLQENGIMAVAKHFPGIGRTVLDSHIDAPFLDTALSEMEPTDLLPFRAAIACDVAGIMLSHIRYTQLDPDLPASLSRRIVQELLRDRMGFQGLVLTDDLDMGAICNFFDIRESVRNLFDAGVDVALVCHEGPDIPSAFEEMLACTARSTAHKELANHSLTRILQTKKMYGLF